MDMDGDDVDSQNLDMLDLSKEVSRFAERSFAMMTPIRVTYVMKNAMIHHTFSSTPDYRELWKTLCDKSPLDAAKASSIEIYMDDILLTNRNTLDLFKEASQAASVPPSLVLMVTKRTDRSGAYHRKSVLCRAIPHVFYLCGLLFLAVALHTRMRQTEETRRDDIAKIAGLRGDLKAAKDRAALETQAREDKLRNLAEMKNRSYHHRWQWERERRQQVAALENITGVVAATQRKHAETVGACATKIHNLKETLAGNRAHIQKQVARIERDDALIDDLTGTLAATKDRHDQELHKCTTNYDNMLKQIKKNTDRIGSLTITTEWQQKKLDSSERTLDNLTDTIDDWSRHAENLAHCWEYLSARRLRASPQA